MQFGQNTCFMLLLALMVVKEVYGQNGICLFVPSNCPSSNEDDLEDMKPKCLKNQAIRCCANDTDNQTIDLDEIFDLFDDRRKHDINDEHCSTSHLLDY